MEYNFNAAAAVTATIGYIRNWFNKNANDKAIAVIGISGGKDSTVVAKLCVEALGADRVFGVMMPNGFQSDINVSKNVCKYLGIKHCTINIGASANALSDAIFTELKQPLSLQSITNLPPRLRMTTLYAVAQNMNGFVINTSNLSEDWIGWATIGGDTMGAFGPISMFTCSEVIAIGEELHIPDEFIHKAPSDGLTNKTDEDAFGYSYATLDKYLRTGEIENIDTKNKVDYSHKRNLFKLRSMDIFVPDENIFYDEVPGDNELPPCYDDARSYWKVARRVNTED